MRQIGIEGGDARVSLGACMRPRQLVRRTDAELRRTGNHPQSKFSRGSCYQHLQRAIGRAIIHY